MITNRSLSRRTFLRGAGVALSLPLLDAMVPAVGADRLTARPPRRMIAVQTNTGILPQNFFPTDTGRNYTLTPLSALPRSIQGPHDRLQRRLSSGRRRRPTRRRGRFFPPPRIRGEPASETAFPSISSRPSGSVR